MLHVQLFERKFASMDESAKNENPPSEDRKPNYALLARMMVREGKPFKESALVCGYSASVAASGLKRLLRDSGPAADAYNHEISRFAKLEHLKPIAVRRLYTEIEDLTSNQAMKAIELAGRFKENDWFIKSGADVQIGIFSSLAASESDPASDSLTSYVDKPDESDL